MVSTSPERRVSAAGSSAALTGTRITTTYDKAGRAYLSTDARGSVTRTTYDAASRVLTGAAFKSGLRRYETDRAPWRPEWLCYYFINDAAPPSFVVDVSAHYDRKREALACFRSQFAPTGDTAVSTRLTVDSFRQLIESRDAQFGAQAGVAFAEGVIVREPIVRATLLRTE